jgi:hypothetical protein
MKEIKQTIQREGKVKLSRVPARDITAMAKAMVEANPTEWLAKAKASSVVQDELRRLQAKEERKRQRQLERNSEHLCNSQRPTAQALPVNETHAQNGATR